MDAGAGLLFLNDHLARLAAHFFSADLTEILDHNDCARLLVLHEEESSTIR